MKDIRIFPPEKIQESPVAESLDAVIQSIYHCFMTRPKEVPFAPDVGVGIQEFIFEPNVEDVRTILLHRLRNNLRWLTIRDVAIRQYPDEHLIEICLTILYREPVQITIFVGRPI